MRLAASALPFSTTGANRRTVMQAASVAVGAEPLDQSAPVDHWPPPRAFQESEQDECAAAAAPCTPMTATDPAAASITPTAQTTPKRLMCEPFPSC